MALDLTRGSILKNIYLFALPYLLSCFLQTFYGVADLYIAGVFCQDAADSGASVTSAITIGSQIMHMITLLLAGFAMGVTVKTAQAFGAKDDGLFKITAANSISGFGILAVLFLILVLPFTPNIIQILQTPAEAYDEALLYTTLCFCGIPLIAGFNVMSAIFRGAGDTVSPMICIAIGGIFNILLDYLFMGPMHMGAQGAAIATVIAQFMSVLSAAILLRRIQQIKAITRQDFRWRTDIIKSITRIGFPTSCQDGLIQIAFLVITAIANSRGLAVSAGVGIVEKLICFFFLVPSSMLAAVSAIAAQNRGAGYHDRAREVLRKGIATTCIYGFIIGIGIQPAATWIISLFQNNQAVIALGAEYIKTYIFDVALAGVHFCFSGYFCAYDQAKWTFVHNAFSALFIRIPGTWLAAVLYPTTLYEMGIVAPIGSIVSILICVCVYQYYKSHGFYQNTLETKSC